MEVERINLFNMGYASTCWRVVYGTLVVGLVNIYYFAVKWFWNCRYLWILVDWQSSAVNSWFWYNIQDLEGFGVLIKEPLLLVSVVEVIEFWWHFVGSIEAWRWRRRGAVCVHYKYIPPKSLLVIAGKNFLEQLWNYQKCDVEVLVADINSFPPIQK